MLPQQRQQTGENLSTTRAAEFAVNGQQPDFADRSAGGQVRIEIGNFLIKRERTVAPRRQHADNLLVVETNEVGVLRVKLVHEPMGRRGVVLRNFLDEGAVVQAMDLLELPVFRGKFEHEGGTRGTHDLVCCGFADIARRADQAGNSARMFCR